MCGIVGLISKQGTLSSYCAPLFTNMLRMDSVRGPDSTGCFGVTSQGQVDMLKGDTDGWLFTTTKQYGDFAKRIGTNYKVVIGHNRKATSGKITAANAHPFQHKHIMMVHNGAIKNSKGIAETEVDSEAIAHALAQHDPVTALGKLDGAYAIVWWDESDKTLSLARNKERPLFLLEYGFHWAIASEPGLPLWLHGREERKADKILVVPTEKILTFNLENLSKGYYEIPYEEFKVWSAPKVQWKSPNPEPFKSANDWPKASVVDLTPRKAATQAPAKAGDSITFVLMDSKQENGAEVLIGHPIIDNEVDENIFVRTVLKKGEDPFKYFGMGADKYTNEKWTGRIQNVRPMHGYWTFYVHEMEPLVTVEDAQNNEHPKEEVEEAIKDGCSRCRNKMDISDVANGIVRKRNDGTWRIVCPPCLTLSMKQAQERKPEITLRERTH